MQLIAALPTPFVDGHLDLAHFKRHVLWLKALGISGFAVAGTTGEFLSLDDDELLALIRATMEAADRHPVFVNPWRPSVPRTLAIAERAWEMGAIAAFAPPPIYYPLPQREIGAWYRELAAGMRLPLLGYHIPKYANNGIGPQLYAELLDEGVIVGLKDSSKDVARLDRFLSLGGEVYIGGDRLLPEVMADGRVAAFISGAVNAWPHLALRMVNGEDQLAPAWLERVSMLRRLGGLRALKTALGMGCRSPLRPVSPASLATLPEIERPR